MREVPADQAVFTQIGLSAINAAIDTAAQGHEAIRPAVIGAGTTVLIDAAPELAKGQHQHLVQITGVPHITEKSVERVVQIVEKTGVLSPLVRVIVITSLAAIVDFCLPPGTNQFRNIPQATAQSARGVVA